MRHNEHDSFFLFSCERQDELTQVSYAARAAPNVSCVFQGAKRREEGVVLYINVLNSVLSHLAIYIQK